MPASKFLIAGLTLVLIDLLLAGDNAFVIAMAVRHLPPRERRIASVCGAAIAVILRVGLTFVAAAILEVRFVKLAGGLFILWIAFQVLRDAGQQQEEVEAAPRGMARAIWYVLFADLTMSTDNILAIAGASGGHFGLILFGLAVSIPFIVVSSNLLARLMDRYPVVIYVGAAILGKVGGDMALTDPWVTGLIHISDVARYAIDAALIAAILIAGRFAAKKSSNSPA
ncbi:MAG: TerC family protein [Bryobacteraceae bacterium]|jgi:YjbE family integral membrane protein